MQLLPGSCYSAVQFTIGTKQIMAYINSQSLDCSISSWTIRKGQSIQISHKWGTKISAIQQYSITGYLLSVMYQSRLFIYLEQQLLRQTYWGEFSSWAIDGTLLLCHLSAEQTCDEQTHYIPWWWDLNLLLDRELCWIETSDAHICLARLKRQVDGELRALLQSMLGYQESKNFNLIDPL